MPTPSSLTEMLPLFRMLTELTLALRLMPEPETPATIEPLLVRVPPLAMPRMPLLASPTEMLPEFVAVGATRPVAPLAPRVIEPELVARPAEHDDAGAGVAAGDGAGVGDLIARARGDAGKVRVDRDRAAVGHHVVVVQGDDVGAGIADRGARLDGDGEAVLRTGIEAGGRGAVADDGDAALDAVG